MTLYICSFFILGWFVSSFLSDYSPFAWLRCTVCNAPYVAIALVPLVFIPPEILGLITVAPSFFFVRKYTGWLN